MRQFYHYNTVSLVEMIIKSAEEWMSQLRIKVYVCQYKDKDRCLKEQFINGINDMMIAEIIKDLTDNCEEN